MWNYRWDPAGCFRVTFFEIYEPELELIKPLIIKRLREAKKKYEYYQDIHEGGEATEHEETLRLKWEETVASLEHILHRMS